MKDYRVNKKEQPAYIIEAVPGTYTVQEKGKTADVETLEVHFADGKVFKNVKYDKENLDKIIKRQEEQAAQGVENLPVFKRRLTLSGIMAAASIVGGPFIAANVVPAVEQAMQVESDPTRISLATGVLVLCGVIPSAVSALKNLPIIKELKKIKYRDEHREQLDHFDDYENALVGLTEAQQTDYLEAKSTQEDPFCITKIDQFTIGEMETIVENIEREKAFQFTYVNRPTQPAKNK